MKWSTKNALKIFVLWHISITTRVRIQIVAFFVEGIEDIVGTAEDVEDIAEADDIKGLDGIECAGDSWAAEDGFAEIGESFAEDSSVVVESGLDAQIDDKKGVGKYCDVQIADRGRKDSSSSAATIAFRFWPFARAASFISWEGFPVCALFLSSFWAWSFPLHQELPIHRDISISHIIAHRYLH